MIADASVHTSNETAVEHYTTALRDLPNHVRQLSMLRAVPAIRAIAFDWSVIAIASIVAVWFAHWTAWMIAAIVIATRQHALLIIMHDASHYRLLKNRQWNDRVSNWFLAYPLLVTTESYRANHLAHHRFLNTHDDPDWVRKEGHEEWLFPKCRWDLIMLFVRDLIGGGFIDQLKAIYDLGGRRTSNLTEQRSKSVAGRLLYYAIIGTAIVGTGVWLQAVLLWFLPAFTLLPVILRIRSIAEHFGVEGTHELNTSRNFVCGFWERLLLAPHNVGYHLDHHLFPSVPFYNLPLLHRVLLDDQAYTASAHLNEGITGLYRDSVEKDVVSSGKC
jgi:fatty acid desaturase